MYLIDGSEPPVAMAGALSLASVLKLGMRSLDGSAGTAQGTAAAAAATAAATAAAADDATRAGAASDARTSSLGRPWGGGFLSGATVPDVSVSELLLVLRGAPQMETKRRAAAPTAAPTAGGDGSGGGSDNSHHHVGVKDVLVELHVSSCAHCGALGAAVVFAARVFAREERLLMLRVDVGQAGQGVAWFNGRPLTGFPALVLLKGGGLHSSDRGVAPLNCSLAEADAGAAFWPAEHVVHYHAAGDGHAQGQQRAHDATLATGPFSYSGGRSVVDFVLLHGSFTDLRTDGVVASWWDARSLPAGLELRALRGLATARAAFGGALGSVAGWLAAAEGGEELGVDVLILMRGLLFVLYVALTVVVLLVFSYY